MFETVVEAALAYDDVASKKDAIQRRAESHFLIDHPLFLPGKGNSNSKRELP